MSLIKMQFDPNVARDVGTDAAIILSNIEYWQAKNKANKKHLHDGKYWTYNSVDAFTELFDYLTPSKIKTCLKNLEDGGYIITGNFNKSAYDRTKWYCAIREIHLPELANGKDETSQPIPDSKPNSKPNTIIENYPKEIFFEDWNELRKEHLKKPSFIKSMSYYDLSEFKNLSKDYTREDFRRALIGLFRQKKMPNDIKSMQTNPTHFLKFFNSYFTAYHDKESSLYGKISQE